MTRYPIHRQHNVLHEARCAAAIKERWLRECSFWVAGTPARVLPRVPVVRERKPWWRRVFG